MATINSNRNKRTFTHLSEFERGQIAALWAQGLSKADIAREIRRNRSTVGREIKRGTVRQMKSGRTYHELYLPDAGQRVYEENRARCGRRLKLFEVEDFILFAEEKILNDKWSPATVCNYAKKNNLFSGKRVCTQTLYTYIALALIRVRNIDWLLKVRRSTRKNRVRKHRKILGTNISERPSHIEDRSEFGHWEIDTVIGHRERSSCLLTLTERKTRMELIFVLPQKDSTSVSRELRKLQRQSGSSFEQVFKSITADNGSEFSELDPLFADTQTNIYFAHPYSSWERGSNERQNGLIRRFIPKGQDIGELSLEQIAKVRDWINTLPRKIFN